jgi:hypothetical protein
MKMMCQNRKLIADSPLQEEEEGVVSVSDSSSQQHSAIEIIDRGQSKLPTSKLPIGTVAIASSIAQSIAPVRK